MSDNFTSDEPTFDPAAAPETIVLKIDHMRLELAWREGKAAEISAKSLRAACRCAWCTRARIDGTFAASFDAITIDRLTPVGDYAINIAFSDGHARGIYPWAYLYKIAETHERLVTKIASGAAANAQAQCGTSE